MNGEEREQWISDQKENSLFRGGGDTSQSDRMLQYGGVNKIYTAKQARLITAARTWDKAMGLDVFSGLCTAVELSQMAVDAQARQDFMKVAIEQWQGKINAKKPTIGSVLG